MLWNLRANHDSYRNCGTLNEFRKFFGLKQYDTFEEINPDPYVAEQLKHLYEHPDFVELYPGIATEAAKDPVVVGVGICPTYTISRAGKSSIDRDQCGLSKIYADERR